MAKVIEENYGRLVPLWQNKCLSTAKVLSLVTTVRNGCVNCLAKERPGMSGKKWVCRLGHL
jgi:hypothetical protein